MLKDLTQGRPGRVLLLYAIPSLISVVFQQLYNMADNVVAGQFLGDSALSAVSVTYPVTMLYLAVALGINAGSNILISQLFGAKRMEDMKTAVSTAMLSCIAISVILMVLGLVFCQPLLRLLSTPVDLIADTSRYLLIYTCGLPFIFLYNICTSVFTALGDTVTPLIFLVISSLSNIGLNVVFVTAVELGVAGLALATFICQAAAGLVSLFVLLRRLHKIPCGRWKRYSLPLLRSLSALAVPSILQKSSISIGNLLIQGLVNSFEATVPGIIGGFSSASKLTYVVITLNTATSGALAGFTAQNIGGKKPERLRPGLRCCFAICACTILPALVFFLGFSTAAMRMFVPAESKDIIAVGITYLRFVSPFLIVLAIKQSVDGILQGAGDIREFMTSTCVDLVLRVVLAYILSNIFGYLGIWYAWPLGWGVGCILSLIFYFRGRWKDVHLLDRVKQ